MTALGRFRVTKQESDLASFKTPNLRNVDDLVAFMASLTSKDYQGEAAQDSPGAVLGPNRRRLVGRRERFEGELLAADARLGHEAALGRREDRDPVLVPGVG